MSKKIVVITGSPRKNGNSFAMTEAFIKEAEAMPPKCTWAAAMPARPAIRRARPVPLTMISI